MTLEETRQLGIEFERRCQTFDPSLQTVGKLDTEDIYSFLNQYQLQFVKQLYLTQDKLQNGTYTASKIRDYLKSLIKRDPEIQVNMITTYSLPGAKLPDKYFMYIASFTHFDSFIQPNESVDIKTIQDIQNEYFDRHRIIRKPLIAIVDDNKIIIKAMDGLKPTAITIDYVEKPSEFTILGDDPKSCELPSDCFEDLVNGAVELFFNYRYKVSLARNAAKEKAKQHNNKDKEDKEDNDD